MSETTEYVPPKVWTWDKESGGSFANINRRVQPTGPAATRPLEKGIV